jgi:hypothetical protein
MRGFCPHRREALMRTHPGLFAVRLRRPYCASAQSFLLASVLATE